MYCDTCGSEDPTVLRRLTWRCGDTRIRSRAPLSISRSTSRLRSSRLSSMRRLRRARAHFQRRGARRQGPVQAVSRRSERRARRRPQPGAVRRAACLSRWLGVVAIHAQAGRIGQNADDASLPSFGGYAYDGLGRTNACRASRLYGHGGRNGQRTYYRWILASPW